jgi:hypothetical protein
MEDVRGIITDESSEVADEEILLRRVYPSDVTPCTAGTAGPRAVLASGFHPNEHDSDGISLFRAAFAQPEELRPRRPKAFFVVKLRAGEVRKLGISVVPKPEADGPHGHVVLPEINYVSRKSDKSVELRQFLAEKLSFEVIGPIEAGERHCEQA